MNISKLFPVIEPHSAAERRWLGAVFILTGVVLALDQFTKILTVRMFELHESHPVIDGLFNLTYVRNYGAAWSILSGHIWLLLLIAVLVVAGTIWKFRYLTEGYSERYLAIFLVFGGVLGNSIDRIWRGAVVDFLDFYIKSYHWPVFNVADIAICCGVGIFMLSSLLRKEKKTP
jgi:signal peptidase II